MSYLITNIEQSKLVQIKLLKEGYVWQSGSTIPIFTSQFDSNIYPIKIIVKNNLISFIKV